MLVDFLRANADIFAWSPSDMPGISREVSAVVVVERQEEGHALSVQRPVYYISEVLSETKTRYP